MNLDDRRRRAHHLVDLPEFPGGGGERPAWHLYAACHGVDTAMFFTVRGEHVEPARRICDACPVKPDCLDFALEHRERWGMWGGTSERQRRTLRRRRDLAPVEDTP